MADGGLNPRKIAILRANALGDYLFATPALEALRARFPRAELVLLGRAWHRELLEGRPGPIDRVEVIPPYPGVGAESGVEADQPELDRFFSRMQGERFELAVQIHGGGRYSNPFVRRLGATLAIGLKSDDAAPLDRWIPFRYYQPERMRYLEVVGLVGATPVTVESRLQVTEQDRREVAGWIASAPLAVLHPGAADPRRRWPAFKFAMVGDALCRAGARVAVTGTEEEREVVDEVVGRMEAPALDLCGTLSLGALAALLAESRVVVANDTGPLHLADAVGASTVGIFWCGNLINGGPLTRGRHHPLLSWRLECPECGTHCIRGRCDHRPSFVAEVPADEVIDAALAFLEGSGTRPR